jgi:hypothetical protein
MADPYDLGPECPYSPAECCERDDARYAVQVWVQQELDECMTLMVTGVIEPALRALARVVQDNARLVEQIRGAAASEMDRLIEANTEYLLPLLSTLQPVQAPVSVSEQRYSSPQYMARGELTSVVSPVTTTALVPAQPARPVAPAPAPATIQEHVAPVGYTEATIAEIVALASAREQAGREARGRYAAAAATPAVSEQQPSARTTPGSNPAAGAQLSYSVWYLAAGDPTVVVTSSDDTVSVDSLGAAGYRVIASYPASLGWSPPQVLDQSLLDVQALTPPAVSAAPELGPEGVRPTADVGSAQARQQPPVDWWTQGTDWILGPWDPGVRHRAEQYYGAAFSAVMGASSFAEAFAAINLPRAQEDVFGQQPGGGTPGGGSTPPLFGD